MKKQTSKDIPEELPSASKEQPLPLTEEQSKISKRQARVHLEPAANACLLMYKLANDKALEPEDLFEELQSSNKKVLDGKLSNVESLLLNQSRALDALFYHYTNKALTTTYVNQVQTFTDLALKSQKQCRNTLMALAEMKNPKHTTYIKQVNAATNQQINNVDVQKVEVKNSEKLEKSANELLKEVNNATMDITREKAPVTVNPEMEAME